MTRKRRARRRASRLALEHLCHGARHTRPTPGLALVLARFIGVLGALARASLGLAFSRRTKGNTGPSGLGKTDGNGLLGRSRPVLATADLVNLFANEFAGLSRGRLARTLVLASLLDGSLVRRSFSAAAGRSVDGSRRGGRASSHAHMPCQRAWEPN